MKKFLLTLIVTLHVGLCFGQAVRSVPTIDNMVTNVPPTILGGQSLLVTDSARGGLFKPVAVATTNSGTIFPSTIDATKVWQRIYNGPIDARWFGATLNDSSDNDATAINDAISVGPEVFLASGTFHVSTPVIIKTGVRLFGDGNYSSIIYLKDGSNDNVLESENFSTLDATPDADAPWGFTLENLTIDGNRTNNSSGWGVKLFAARYTVDMTVQQCYDGGFYSRYTSTGVPSGLPNGGVESQIKYLDVKDSYGNGIEWYGPHDSYADLILTHENFGFTNMFGGTDIGPSSITHPSIGILLSSKSLDSGGLTIDKLHTYANVYGLVVTNGGFLKANYVFADGNYMQGAMLAREKTHIGVLNSIKNSRLRNGQAHVELLNNQIEISSLYIDDRYSGTVHQTNNLGYSRGLLIQGNNNTIGSAHIWGARSDSSQTGTTNYFIGAVVEGNHNRLYGRIYDATNSNSIGLLTGNGAARIFNDINLNLTQLATAWKNDQDGNGTQDRVDNWNRYSLNIAANLDNGEIVFSGDIPEREVALGGTQGTWTGDWNIVARGLTNTSQQKFFLTRVNKTFQLDFSDTTEKTITVQHECLFAPFQQNIMYDIRRLGTADNWWSSLSYANIENITSDSFDFVYKPSGTLSNNPWVVFYIRL